MKQVIDLRPVYHRREDRIRAHVILCWLALLLYTALKIEPPKKILALDPAPSAS
jgi:transposase